MIEFFSFRAFKAFLQTLQFSPLISFFFGKAKYFNEMISDYLLFNRGR